MGKRSPHYLNFAMRTTLFLLLFLVISCGETKRRTSADHEPPSDSPQTTNPHFDLPRTSNEKPTEFDSSDFIRTAKWLCIQSFPIESFKDNQIIYNQKRKDFFDLVQSLRDKKINWSFSVDSVSEPNVVNFRPIEIEVDGTTCKCTFRGVHYLREKAITLRAGDSIRCNGTIRRIFYNMEDSPRLMIFELSSNE